MHELGIAESIARIVRDEITKKKLTDVTAVVVRVGALSDVVPEALEFGFEVCTKGSSLEGVQLKIERLSVKGECNNCQRDFEVHENIFLCPNCESFDIKMTQGQELDIAYLETGGIEEPEIK